MITRFNPKQYAKLLAEKNKLIRHVDGSKPAFFTSQTLNGFDALLDGDAAGKASSPCLVYVDEVSSRIADMNSDNHLDQDFHTLIVCVRSVSDLGDNHVATAKTTAQTIARQIVGRMRQDRRLEYTGNATVDRGLKFLKPESITQRSLGTTGNGWFALALMFTTEQPTASLYNASDWDG